MLLEGLQWVLDDFLHRLETKPATTVTGAAHPLAIRACCRLDFRRIQTYSLYSRTMAPVKGRFQQVVALLGRAWSALAGCCCNNTTCNILCNLIWPSGIPCIGAAVLQGPRNRYPHEYHLHTWLLGQEWLPSLWAACQLAQYNTVGAAVGIAPLARLPAQIRKLRSRVAASPAIATATGNKSQVERIAARCCNPQEQPSLL